MRCIRVEDKQGTKIYYCIDSDGRTHVFQKNEMIKATQMHNIENATLFIRNGVICIRVNNAVKEKVSTNRSAINVVDTLINQIIRKMQAGVVNCNMGMMDFLDELGLPEFKQSKEIQSDTPKSLVSKAKKVCERNGQYIYIMGLRADDGKGYEIIFATTNKRRGVAEIQKHVKNKVVKASTENEMTTEEIKVYLEHEQAKIFFTY